MSNARRIVSGLVLLAALAALARFGYLQFLGVSRTYPECVAAMKSVAAGQLYSEAEEAVAKAVASGADRWQPGSHMLWVSCSRYDPDLAAELDLETGGSYVTAIRLWGQLELHGAYNRTKFQLVRDGDRVSAVTALDCSEGGIDTMNCRAHGEPRTE